MSARSNRRNTINSVKFRVRQAETALAQATEIIRVAAGEPGYKGPPFAAVEQIRNVVTLLGKAVVEWSDQDAVAHPRIGSIVQLQRLVDQSPPL